MKCICSYSTSNRKELYATLNFCKYKYAEIFRVDYVFEELQNFDKHAAWYKMPFILKMFDKYDLVYFLDDDASFIRYDTDLFSSVDEKTDVTIAQTVGKTNTGSFSIKKNDRTINALKYASTLYEQYKADPFYEQNALLSAFNKFGVTMTIIDDQLINSSVYTRTEKSIILHLMGKIKNIENIDYFRCLFNVLR